MQRVYFQLQGIELSLKSVDCGFLLFLCKRLAGRRYSEVGEEEDEKAIAPVTLTAVMILYLATKAKRRKHKRERQFALCHAKPR